MDRQIDKLVADLAELAAHYRKLAGQFSEVKVDFANSAPNWKQVACHFAEVDRLNAKVEVQLKIILIKSGVILS